jgi:hypothetical protein
MVSQLDFKVDWLLATGISNKILGARLDRLFDFDHF